MSTRYDIYDSSERLLYKNVSLAQTAAILELDEFEVSAMMEEHGRVEIEGLVALPAGETINA